MTHRVRACRISRLFAVCAVAAGVLASVAPAAVAPAAVASTTGASTTGTASPMAWLRLANLSPGAPSFDIYLYPVGNSNATLVLTDISYGMASPYKVVPAGGYTVALRPAGKPASSLPVLSTTISVAAGHAYTITSTGPSSGPRLELLNDALTTPKGKTLVRIIQASVRQGRVTVTAGRDVLVRDLAFGSATTYATVPPGPLHLRAVGATMTASDREKLRAGTTYTVVVLDGAGRLQLDCLMDGAGSTVPPRGGAGMGFGGTASRPGASPAPWTAGIAGGALLAACGTLWLRRTRRAE